LHPSLPHPCSQHQVYRQIYFPGLCFQSRFHKVYMFFPGHSYGRHFKLRCLKLTYSFIGTASTMDSVYGQVSWSYTCFFTGNCISL
jgi:hypothetical protein